MLYLFRDHMRSIRDISAKLQRMIPPPIMSFRQYRKEIVSICSLSFSSEIMANDLVVFYFKKVLHFSIHISVSMSTLGCSININILQNLLLDILDCYQQPQASNNLLPSTPLISQVDMFSAPALVPCRHKVAVKIRMT